MKTIFKYDKVRWLLDNPEVLDLIPLKYDPQVTILNNENLMSAYKIMQANNLMSDKGSRLNPGFSIIKLASEARKYLRRIDEDHCNFGKTGCGEDNISRQPITVTFEMRADAIRQMPV